ncbi:DUF2235 domain-containing protein [Marinobacter sp. SS8-8]|uniref:DUF2235 domain-containing protein n=1 Tax=Marinobacter sp. SS8-8 TaxID=3050452 RepID=UPI0026E04401|nr:DUF2235 domain-containing protein [Marinobacter sp. SS8-8]|tara:strand:+ start:6295 stop:7308 length:1014 start_codon:yes stop_codon:yes gene_type:complete
MVKRLVVCADGTWNRPEEDLQKDVPTNVLRMARAIRPLAADGRPQHVFYDWGIGSYYNAVMGGVTGQGIHKNIMDAYRYIVQNFTPGTDLYLFGFSRGAYTVRSLCGLINNCGILKRPDARLIQQAFDHYKKTGDAWKPSGAKSVAFRNAHSHESREIRFVGAWDTVGALGVPFSLMGLFDRKDEFYDTKLGSNVRIARHALAIDERREDFEPTLWEPRDKLDLQQVWFAGSHSDIGGGYPADDQGLLASDSALEWMVGQARSAGLDIEDHLPAGINPSARARLHNSRRHIFRFSTPLVRNLKPDNVETTIHPSVAERWRLDTDYRPPNLQQIGFAG